MSFDIQPIPCDEDKFQRVRAKFLNDGVLVPNSASGEIDSKGVTANFTWNGAILRITVTHKPFIYPQGLVEEHLIDYISLA